MGWGTSSLLCCCCAQCRGREEELRKFLGFQEGLGQLEEEEKREERRRRERRREEREEREERGGEERDTPGSGSPKCETDPRRVAVLSSTPTSKEAPVRRREEGVSRGDVKHVQMISIVSRLSTGSCSFSLSLSITLCPTYPILLYTCPILLSLYSF